MHCPKCGDKMIFKNNSMYCERGNMLLTHTLYARFNARFVEKIPEEPLLQRMQNPRGRWFCPACGQRLRIDGPHVHELARGRQAAADRRGVTGVRAGSGRPW